MKKNPLCSCLISLFLILVMCLRKKKNNPLLNIKVSSGFQAKGWFMGNLVIGHQMSMLDTGSKGRMVPGTEQGARLGWTGYSNSEMQPVQFSAAPLIKELLQPAFNPIKSTWRWELVPWKAACYMLAPSLAFGIFERPETAILKRFKFLKNGWKEHCSLIFFQALKAWYQAWCSTGLFLYWVTFARAVNLVFFRKEAVSSARGKSRQVFNAKLITINLLSDIQLVWHYISM